MTTAGTLNLGPYRYRPGKQLDETRMSILWLAGEVSREGTVSPGDQVIVKIARMSETQYSLTNQRAIENEEKWLVNLSHPNIIRLRPVAERHASRQTVYRARSDLPGNPWFLVTDYLSGGDLQSLLNERRKLPVSLALQIAEQLGDALTYLHARNCVHCDIKPRNILFHEQPTGYSLTEATRPIVIDFGIAKNPSDGPQAPSGTPRWITPELYEALRVGRKQDVDPSWDVYAAGLVLYSMITGRRPELDRPGSHSWLPITMDDLAGDISVKQSKQIVEGLNRLIAGTTADLSVERIDAPQFVEGVRKLRQYTGEPSAAPVASRRQRSNRVLWLAMAGGTLSLMLAVVLYFAITSTSILEILLPGDVPTHAPTPVVNNNLEGIHAKWLLPQRDTLRTEPVDFAWSLDANPGANQCVELRIWEGDLTAWGTGMAVRVDTTSTMQHVTIDTALSPILRPGVRANVAIVLTQCEPYIPFGTISNIRSLVVQE